jgi:hypothetical protein
VPERYEKLLIELIIVGWGVPDEPIGMLGDVTPRAAARTPSGREKLAAWLKYPENRSASQADPADFNGNLRLQLALRELGVEELG